jgi:hypothetical protein
MADKKITQLDAVTSVTSDDLFLIVDNPSGTPTSKKVTTANVAASIAVIGLDAGSGVRTAIHGIRLPLAHTIEFEGTTDNAFQTILSGGDPTADRTVTLPDATGTIALVGQQAYWG